MTDDARSLVNAAASAGTFVDRLCDLTAWSEATRRGFGIVFQPDSMTWSVYVDVVDGVGLRSRRFDGTNLGDLLGAVLQQTEVTG